MEHNGSLNELLYMFTSFVHAIPLRKNLTFCIYTYQFHALANIDYTILACILLLWLLQLNSHLFEYILIIYIWMEFSETSICFAVHIYRILSSHKNVHMRKRITCVRNPLRKFISSFESIFVANEKKNVFTT